MDLISPNLNLPYLAPAQAQKHVTHNEALRQLDAIVQLSVATVADTPPTEPDNGDRVIIGAAPTGDFTDKPHQLAAFQDGAWAYYVPKTGWRAYIEDAAGMRIFDGSLWQVQSGGSSETADKFGVNTTADTTNRLAAKSPATLLDNDGAGHQLKVNKSAETDTASLLFQSGYTGHAEMGLAGSEDFKIKTSADGSVFQDSLTADAATGAVTFPHGTNISQMTTPVNACGGPDEFYGLPSLYALSDGRGGQTLTQDRMFFSPFYVDRPTELLGGFIAQYSASLTSGAVLRAGIYHLGAASGNHWTLGDLVTDLGSQPADTAGHKDFVQSTGLILQRGWYAAAVGTDGINAEIRYLKTLQAGAAYLSQFGSGASADIYYAGAANYLFDSGANAEITTGLSAQWPSNPVTDISTSNGFGSLFFIPKWKRWD